MVIGPLMNIPPKTTTRIKGVRSRIFTSGARRRERKLPRAMAAAGSDNQGISFSNSREGFLSVFAGAGAGAARFFPEVYCPVYRRRVVR
jgi:hypothetical protein